MTTPPATSSSPAAGAAPAAAPTPAQAWAALADGNRRFLAGRSEHPNQDLDRRHEVAHAQHPFAVVFGCLDSRVASELIFDRGIGDLAVVRTAGHVVDSAVLGSLEFAVSVLRIPLVVVLGHDRCGAMNAALQAVTTGQMPKGYLRDIVERVTPSMLGSQRVSGSLQGLTADELTIEHVRHTVHLLPERSAPIADGIAAGTLAVVGAGYQLTEGKVELVEALGDLGL